ncbi:34414_t:CDS:1, partial [Gigaspora margarita]
ALGFWPVNNSTNKKYYQLFYNGHNAISAWNSYQDNLYLSANT